MPLEWAWPGQRPEAPGQTEEGWRVNPLPGHLGLGGAALASSWVLACSVGGGMTPSRRHLPRAWLATPHA